MIDVYSFKKTVGLPVISLSSGRKQGIVEDALFNFERKCAYALVVGRIAKWDKYIITEDLKKIYSDKVIVENKESLKDYVFADEKEKARLHRGVDILGKGIIDNNGQSLGYVEDLFYDIETSSIEAIQLTDGILQDLVHGRKVVPLIGTVTCLNDYLVLSKEAFEETIESKRGFKALFSKH